MLMQLLKEQLPILGDSCRSPSYLSVRELSWHRRTLLGPGPRTYSDADKNLESSIVVALVCIDNTANFWCGKWSKKLCDTVLFQQSQQNESVVQLSIVLHLLSQGTYSNPVLLKKRRSNPIALRLGIPVTSSSDNRPWQPFSPISGRRWIRRSRASTASKTRALLIGGIDQNASTSRFLLEILQRADRLLCAHGKDTCLRASVYLPSYLVAFSSDLLGHMFGRPAVCSSPPRNFRVLHTGLFLSLPLTE